MDGPPRGHRPVQVRERGRRRAVELADARRRELRLDEEEIEVPEFLQER